MGFYAPAQIVGTPASTGVEVRHLREMPRDGRTLEAIDDDASAVPARTRMVRGLANQRRSAGVAARGDTFFVGRRSLAAGKDRCRRWWSLPMSDSMTVCPLWPGRADRLGAIRRCASGRLELWTAARRTRGPDCARARRNHVAIMPMIAGGEVVENYSVVGLRLCRIRPSFCVRT